MIYLLFISLIVVFVISYQLIGRDLVSPAPIFAASFVFCVAWAVVYAKKWLLGLHANTFFVIIGGVSLFTIVCYLVFIFFERTHPKISDKVTLKLIDIEAWKMVLFILFEILSILYTIRSLKHLTGVPNLGDAVTYYRDATVLGSEQFSFPKFMVLMRLVTNAAGYWFGVVFVNNLIVSKKPNILIFVVISLSAVSASLLGGRGNAINMVLGLVSVAFILLVKQYHWKQTMNFKLVIPAVFFGIVVLYLFKNFGTLMGRDTSASSFDYLAKYCGAQVKNLDLFLQSRNFPNYAPHWGSQTFINLIKPYGGYFGLPNLTYTLTLPFQRINGFNLGNVYTTFYPFVYDFGYIGILFLVPVMAGISQNVFLYAKYALPKKWPSLSVVLYSYIFSSILLSFFSDKFFEQNFAKSTIQTIIIWLVFTVFFCIIRTKRHKIESL